MSEEDNLFQPEQVYEQIELLGSAQSQQMPQSSDARLISNLRQIHAEDREIVEHVWARLAAQARANEQDIPGQLKRNRPDDLLLKEYQPMQNMSQPERPKKTMLHLLELSAAILVIGALVGGMVVLLQKNQQQRGTVGTSTATTIVTPKPAPTSTPLPAVTPTPIATQTQTACNVVHPANMTALSGSTDPALFYMTGGGGYQSEPSNTALIRYDLVTGKQTTLIQPTNDSTIMDVKLSPDKQWLFLRISIGDPATTELQLIRTDGSMLQTLYESCTGGSYVNGSSAWSPNGQEVAFPTSTSGISVLDLTNGNLQTFLPGTGYQPAFWINNQQLLVIQYDASNNSKNTLYLLDMSKGVNQQASNLTLITSVPAFCGNVALSADGTQLFSSSCTAFDNGNCQGEQVQGPSTVSVLPAAGGTARTVYSSQSQAVTSIYSVSASSLLIYIENTTGDLSQDGLWKINVDGSGLTRLTTTNVLACQYGQYAYSMTQISSDGQYYALLSMDGNTQKLVTGSLAGGSLATVVAQPLGASNVLLLAGIGVA